MDNELLQKLLKEMAFMEVSFRGHIIEPFREDLKQAGFVTSDGIRWKEHGSWVRIRRKNDYHPHTPHEKRKEGHVPDPGRRKGPL
ncbi:MAG: hypothetical protein LWX55_12420 [Deltaproteobacteria bacterium]|nr:hypothetical protein [Deltaproteobacteria bacterium]